MFQSQHEEERRATWLETRNLEENFKELVYLSIQEVSMQLGTIFMSILFWKLSEETYYTTPSSASETEQLVLNGFSTCTEYFTQFYFNVLIMQLQYHVS